MNPIKMLLLLCVTPSLFAAHLLYENLNARKIEGLVKTEKNLSEYKWLTSHRSKRENRFENKYTYGRVKEKKISNAINMQPFFVVGSDEYSVAWLKDNSESLRKIKAIGYLVNSKEADELQKIRKIYRGVVMPSNMDEFLEHFNIKHYPFLVNDGWIEQ